MKRKLLCIIIAVITMISSVSMCVSAAPLYPGAPPELYVTDVNYTSVKLEWSDHNDSTYQYLVYRSPSGKKGTWTKLTTTKAGTRSYTDKTAVPNKVYYYTVKSYYYNPSSKLKLVSQMSTVWKVSTEIYRPVFTLVGNGGKGVVLKWDIDKDINGVAIYKSTTGKAGSWTKIKVIGNNKTKTYTDSKVEIGKTYYYCYKVYKTVNGKNYYSQSSKAYKSTILDVSVPQNLKATPVDSGVKLTYSKSLGTIGYLIYRSDTGKAGSWKKIATTKSNNTLEYIDKTAVRGKTYYYTIKSYKKVSGEFFYSASAKGVKVLNDTSRPVFKFSSNEITFNSFYDEQRVIFSFKNVNENDSIRIFYNNIELTEDFINDEKAVEEFVSNCDFFYYVEEDKISYDSLSLCIYRLGPGGGTLRFQHSKYDDVYAEIKVNCPEVDFDKDRLLIYENIDSFYENVDKAWKTLEATKEMSDDTAIGKEVKRAKEYLYEADDCLIEARYILNEYKYYSGNDEYVDLDVEIADLSGCIVFDIEAVENISETSPEKDKINNLCRSLSNY